MGTRVQSIKKKLRNGVKCGLIQQLSLRFSTADIAESVKNLMNSCYSYVIDPNCIKTSEIFSVKLDQLLHCSHPSHKGYCDTFLSLRFPNTTTVINSINANLPIPAYLLGLWLGDGSKSSMAIHSVDIEVKDYLQQVVDAYNEFRPPGKERLKLSEKKDPIKKDHHQQCYKWSIVSECNSSMSGEYYLRTRIGGKAIGNKSWMILTD